MLRPLPLILIAVLTYNVLVLGCALAHVEVLGMLAHSFTVHLVSGDTWTVTAGDLFIALALVLLGIECVRALRSSRAIISHTLAMMTFTGALAEFIMLKGFGTSPFFFLTVMCLFDVVAGYTVSIAASRQDAVTAPADHDHD